MTKTEACSDVDNSFYSCSWMEMDRHWNTTIRRSQMLYCQKPSSECYDTINQSLEEAMEQSTTVTSSKSAGSRSPTTLRNGYLKIGYQLWQKEEERRKDFNIARIQTLPNNSCTLEQSKDIQKKMLLILSCETMYCYRKDLSSTSTTSGTRMSWTP